MSAKSRTAILAAVIVGGLVLSIAGLVGVVVLTGTAGEPRKDAPTVDPKKDPEGYIKAHRWWAKPITQKQLDELVKTIINTNHGYLVCVDDLGNSIRRSDWSSDRPEPKGWEQWKDKKRWFAVEIQGEKRWDRAMAVTELIKKLDKAEFHHGPAKR